jgi:hypothetical protein
MPKLAYYASCISPDKPNQFETYEGYRIYKNVPICRTGFQEYAGKELKSHADYKQEWNLDDNEMVKVYRPKDVVTAPETVASFEGKSVLDGHPPEVLLTVVNESEHGKGHVQNVRVGTAMEDSEIPLIADLWVKNSQLNDKIDNGMREVSCGYLFNLQRDQDGAFFMSRIIGNHVAVVPNGRAGPEVAIGDAASVQASGNKPIIRPKPEINKEKSMQQQGTWLGRLLKALGTTDAAPEDIEKLAKAAKDTDEDDEMRKMREKRDQSFNDRKAAHDAEERDADEEAIKEAKAEKKAIARDKKAKDAEPEEESSGASGEGEYELHPQLQEACDHITHMRGAVDALCEHLMGGKDDAEEEDPEVAEDPEKGEVVAGDAFEADVLGLSREEIGETEFPAQGLPKYIAGDEAFIAEMRPLVIASKNKRAILAFNKKVKTLKATRRAVADSKVNAYAGLGAGNGPYAGADGEEVIDPTTFFNGVNFAEGNKRYQEYLKSKGGKK